MHLTCLHAMLAECPDGMTTPVAADEMAKTAGEIFRRLAAIETALEGRRDRLGLRVGKGRKAGGGSNDDLIPFADEDPSLSERVIAAPAGADPYSAIASGATTHNSWIDAYREAIGTLLRVVLKVERAVLPNARDAAAPTPS